MTEFIEFYKAPNFDIIDGIMDEVREKLGNYSLSEIEFYMNQRVQEEIDNGNFRTTFITPTNRVAEWECILIKVDEVSRKLLILPKWVYRKEDTDE